MFTSPAGIHFIVDPDMALMVLFWIFHFPITYSCLKNTLALSFLGRLQRRKVLSLAKRI